MKKIFGTSLIGNSGYRLYNITEKNWTFTVDSLASGCCCGVFSLLKLNLTFSRLLNIQESCLIVILYKNYIEYQGLDLLKNNVDSATEDPDPKDDVTLKKTKLD